MKFPSSLTYTLSILSVISVFFLLLPISSLAREMEKDPLGFFGIPWGQSLGNRAEFIQIETEEHVDTYALKIPNPQIGGIQVESIKFLTHDNRLAQVTIHYRGETTHRSLLKYLESEYGEIHLNPGSMMRGLNQQYTWRGPETEITVTYRGFVERGFMVAASRVLAPRFLDSVSDHSF
ncbi:MAG: hypothetical protein JSU59_01790 [Nitrospirota bacterium]|nr:MAG: hypothetical protein JSU59_01790 [Nitrospirota bacterium]